MAITLKKVGTGGVVGVVNLGADYLDDTVKVKKTVAGVVTEVSLGDQLYAAKNLLGIGAFALGLAGDRDGLGFIKDDDVSEALYLSSEPLAIAAIVDIVKKLMPVKTPYTSGRLGVSRVEGPHWRPPAVPPMGVSPLRFT